MAKKKSPFRNFTEKEVLRAEATSYVVLIGNDLYSREGSLVFSLTQAEKHYNTLLQNILLTLDSGNTKQKAAAVHCLRTLKVLPLRIH